MNIRLVQLDGKLPNLALMKLAHWHRENGDAVRFMRSIYPHLDEPAYDVVYGSAIFKFSNTTLKAFQQQWPNAMCGGTGTDSIATIEALIGAEYEHYDYTDWPNFDASIGFTQRGCRLSCKFCVVPKKEGKPRSVNTIAQIWRGDPWPRHLHLLDNDLFGNPQWRERLEEINEGRFKVCLNQGINIRMIDDTAATALAQIDYRDDSFKVKRLYTAWDNLGDEQRFFSGVEKLRLAGIPPKHLMVYMLIGYDPKETWEAIWHRFNRMVDAEIQPYPMVYDRSRTDLLCFQRWVIRGLYRYVKWDEYKRSTKSRESTLAYLAVQ
jgi:hypothetical protein